MCRSLGSLLTRSTRPICSGVSAAMLPISPTTALVFYTSRMSRRAAAIFSILLLLFASLMSVGKVSAHDLTEPSLRVVNTDDGVSLEESVLDDLRPGVAMDPHGVSPLDLGMKPSWAFATPTPSTPPLRGHSLPVEHQAPCLEGLLRPPATS